MASNDRRPMLMGAWVAIGIGVRVALGVAMNNLALWLGVGVALGVAVGAALSARAGRGGP